MMHILKKGSVFKAIYMIGFFFGLASAIPSYINSEFLAQYAGNKLVGIIFIIADIAILGAFFLIGKILKKYGAYSIATFLSSVAVLSLLGLMFVKIPAIIYLLFVIYSVAGSILYFNLDIFLITNLTENNIGTVRGTFMSILNSAWIMGPIIAGFIMTYGNYSYVYLAALIALLPVISLTSANLKSFKDSAYRHISVIKILSALPKHKSTYKIIASNFLLQFFYAWMVIYTPIYLHTYIGFDWASIGIIFTIMLFPFALLEAPLGRLADERWGEKEMLTAGFIITAISTIILTFIPVPDFWLWAAGLLATRIGASTIEIMNETFFFKKNQETHPDIIGLFRMTGPSAFIVAALLATILLQFIAYQYLFLILGIIMLWGLRYSLTIKDTL